MVLMIHGDLWKILVAEICTSIDKKFAYFGDFVLFLKAFALKRNLFYSTKSSCRKIMLLYYNVCSSDSEYFALKN